MSTTVDRVRDLIKAHGLSQREFALRIGLDDSKLSKSLSGIRRFSSLDLARIAELCAVTVDWLITGNEPLSVRATGGAAEAIATARRFSAIRSGLASLGYRQPWQPVDVDLGSGSPGEQGIRLADAALARCAGLMGADLPHLVETTFGADVLVVDLAGFDGLAMSSAEVKLIVLATSESPARQRFTLAHELGHLLAGDDHGVHVFDRDRTSAGEVRAGAFAAAFLMPEVRLRTALDATAPSDANLAGIAVDLGVTPTLLATRLATLGMIDADARARLRALSVRQAAAVAGRRAEFAQQVVESTQSRPPGLLVRAAYAAYDTGETTLRPYANLLGVDADRMRQAMESEH